MKRHALAPVRGFTLMEMAIVLGAMSLVLGAIWAVASTVISKNQQRIMQEQVITVVDNVRSLYGVSNKTISGMATTATTDLDKNMIFPVEMRYKRDGTDPGNIRHALGGQVYVYLSPDDGNSFRIHLKNLSKQQCINLLMTFPFLTPELGVTRIKTVSGFSTQVQVTNVSQPDTANVLPFKPSFANIWCGLSTNTNEVMIDFSTRN